MFTHALQKSGHLKELPKEVSPAHVRFVAQHEAELSKLTARHTQRDGERKKRGTVGRS